MAEMWKRFLSSAHIWTIIIYCCNVPSSDADRDDDTDINDNEISLCFLQSLVY